MYRWNELGPCLCDCELACILRQEGIMYTYLTIWSILVVSIAEQQPISLLGRTESSFASSRVRCRR